MTTPNEAILLALKLCRNWFVDEVGFTTAHPIVVEIDAAIDAAIALPAQPEKTTALEKYIKGMAGDSYEPIENLRYFCSKAMNGQDWLDAGPFFDAIALPVELEKLCTFD